MFLALFKPIVLRNQNERQHLQNPSRHFKSMVQLHAERLPCNVWPIRLVRALPPHPPMGLTGKFSRDRKGIKGDLNERQRGSGYIFHLDFS